MLPSPIYPAQCEFPNKQRLRGLLTHANCGFAIFQTSRKLLGGVEVFYACQIREWREELGVRLRVGIRMTLGKSNRR